MAITTKERKNVFTSKFEVGKFHICKNGILKFKQIIIIYFIIILLKMSLFESKLVGYTFIVSSGDETEDSERYKFDRVKFYRKLADVFTAIQSEEEYDVVTYTIDVKDFIRRNEGMEFGACIVGYVGLKEDKRKISVKCVVFG